MLLEAGFGITNLVARATATADGVTKEELRAGGPRLRRKMRRYRPRWVAFLGLGAYRTAFARPGAVVGEQPDGLGPACVWLLPNPSGLNAHYQIDDLAREFGKLRAAAHTRQQA